MEYAADCTTCVTPTHKIWSYKLQRHLTVKELLAAQGIWACDAEVPSAFEEMLGNPTLAQSLAGNCMTGTTVQAVCLAAFVSTQFLWHKVPETHSSGDCGDDGNPEMTQQLVSQPSKSPSSSCGLFVPTFRLRKKTTGAEVLKKLKAKYRSRRGFGNGNKKANGKKPMTTLMQKDTRLVLAYFFIRLLYQSTADIKKMFIYTPDSPTVGLVFKNDSTLMSILFG